MASDDDDKGRGKLDLKAYKTSTNRVSDSLRATLYTFLIVLLLFILHRILSFSYLMPRTGLPLSLSHFVAILVGSLSDAWVATLLAFCCGLLTLLFSPVGRRRFWLWYCTLIFILLGLHQSYIEYFGYQMLPFHFSYFFDFDFLQANGPSATHNWRVQLTWWFGIFLVIYFNRKEIFIKHSATFLSIGVATLFLCTLAGHSANIHLREQLLLPEGLRMNVVEKIYETIDQQTIPDSLQLAEIEQLARSLNKPLPTIKKSLAEEESDILRNLLHQTLPQKLNSPLAENIKVRFNDLQKGGKKPVILIILLESMRPSDSGAYGEDKLTSLTPTLDTIAQTSIIFRNAFSTGTITRGGQEAVWCGHLSSQTTSMMRRRPNLAIDCLPKLSELLPEGQRGSTFWHHGGSGGFDGQKAFWQKQQVMSFLESNDFPEGSPRTDWGIGDVAFFHRAASELVNLRHSTPAPFILGMSLSISNHPPWALPSDAPQNISDLVRAQTHPSYVTTAYTDYALNAYLDELKRTKVWDDSLIILASDHGQQDAPPYFPNRYPAQLEQENLRSHIILMLTGGLVEQAAGELSHEPRVHDEFVSQADIAPFVAYVLGLNNTSFFGETLFSERKTPVVVNTGVGIYFPKTNRSFSSKELMDKNIPQPDLELQDALLYYRAFLRLINYTG